MDRTDLKRRVWRFCILGGWLAGITVGALVSQYNLSDASWLPLIYSSRISVIGFLAMLIIPFLLSALFFRLSLPGLIVPLSFVKAFSYGWCSGCIMLYFHSAGWLVRFLLLFTDTFVAIFLIWFWFRNAYSRVERLKEDTLICLIFTLLIGCIDCCVISPFGISLIL